MALATGTIALMMAGGGAAMSAAGSWKQGSALAKAGKAQQEALMDQAALADFNANVAALQAEDAVLRGELEEQRYRSLVRGTIGTQRTQFAAGNIDANYGTAVDVQADAAMLGELDALTIKTNARREAWGYEVQAEDLRRGGQILRKEGVNAYEAGKAQRTAARIGAIGTVVGVGGSLLMQRYGTGRSSS